jgi:hypothetical protein
MAESDLDQRVFVLDDDAHARFLALLDAPPMPSAEVRARLRRRPLWELGEDAGVSPPATRPPESK